MNVRTVQGVNDRSGIVRDKERICGSKMPPMCGGWNVKCMQALLMYVTFMCY